MSIYLQNYLNKEMDIKLIKKIHNDMINIGFGTRKNIRKYNLKKRENLINLIISLYFKALNGKRK